MLSSIVLSSLTCHKFITGRVLDQAVFKIQVDNFKLTSSLKFTYFFYLFHLKYVKGWNEKANKGPSAHSGIFKHEEIITTAVSDTQM